MSTATRRASGVLPTFEVDKAGLAKILARKGKEFAIVELVQNAWDENTTHVDVTLERLDGDRWRLVVEDDNPEGFADLRHAYTLFAESAKKSDPTKRGRFNLGEKLVIAVCEEASIVTTKGTILFTAKGRRMLDKTRSRGSVFTGTMKLSDEEATTVERAVYALIPPEGITTTFNMGTVPARDRVTTFEAALRTEKGDADGNLRPTTRRSRVDLYEPLDGERAMLYEMGIPVVETGDRWHVDVQQKVPLNTDRDNVPPSYLRDVRALVLNSAHERLAAEETSASWVSEAIEDEIVEPEAVRSVVAGRFGEKAVISDPTDREANHLAASKGYNVVAGGSLSREAWENVRRSEALLPAGQVTPSPKPDASGATRMNPEHYPECVAAWVAWSKAKSERWLTKATGRDVTVKVVVVNEPHASYLATWGRHAPGYGELTWNYGRLGYGWFEKGVRAESVDILVHEAAHHAEGGDSHLDERYFKMMSKLGGIAFMDALADPESCRAAVAEAVA